MSLIDLKLRQHRQVVLADRAEQRLFVSLMLRPSTSMTFDRSNVTLSVVVDQSGSMMDRSGVGHLTRIGVVQEALRASLLNGRLGPSDRVSISGFNDRAIEHIDLVSASNVSEIAAAIDQLRNCHGSTYVAEGLGLAVTHLSGTRTGVRRVVLLTDGAAYDADAAKEVAVQLGEIGVPITAIGVGSDWNMELLGAFAEASHGTLIHVIPDSDPPFPPSLRLSELPDAITQQIRQAEAEVVTDLQLFTDLAPGVTVRRVTRVLPTINESVSDSQGRWSMGNVARQQGAAFILEIGLDAFAPQGPSNLGKIFVSNNDASGNAAPVAVSEPLVLAFTTNASEASVIDHEVQQLVQQRNLDAIVQQAAEAIAKKQVDAAKEALGAATRIAQGVGNSAMTVVLNRALGELNDGKTVAANLLHSAQVGARTKTVNVGDGWLTGLTDEEIRRITGV